MDRNEFTGTLRAVLTGEVPPAVVEDNVRYYDSYISQEIAGGKSEKEVLESLGDPRLIAKTIIDTQGGQGAYHGGASYSQDPPVRERRAYSESDESGGEWKYHRVNLNTWYGRLLTIVITVLILALVFTIVGGILSWVLPILLPVLLILWVIRIFFGGGRRGW